MPLQVRNRHLFLYDVAAVLVSPLLAFVIRFEDLRWLAENPRLVWFYAIPAAGARLAAFYGLGLYRRLWRHASVGELRQIVLAGLASAGIAAALGLVLLPLLGLIAGRVPLSVLLLDVFMVGAAVAVPRVFARVNPDRVARRRRDDLGKPVLVVGAGTTGKAVVKELLSSNHLNLRPIGFVDDDMTKHNHVLCDLPVLGPLSKIKDIVQTHGVGEIVIAMPNAPGAVVRKVVRAALDANVSTLTVPSLHEVITRQASRTALREVEIEDLLRRDPVQTDLASVATLITNETVLITGAGGSIGSELCRQIGRLAPSRMVLLGHGENSIFDIAHELHRSFPDVRISPVIADIRDRARIHRVLNSCKPHAIFHAAAHKHVPLMEDNVEEAVTNNVIGTKNLTDAAIEAGTQHFVLISTDKAVRPTSVMGATKRIAEQIVQDAAMKAQRNFVAVRFGNVLGSRGSVVPTFLRQIREGGPVTVTHPEMQRFFMTIPESVQLVLQAGAMGNGGEVFVLDMGEPVRVVDLATDLIRLSGLDVGTEIEIKFTGIRPGEKLYEEMFFVAENGEQTSHPKILRARIAQVTEGLTKKLEVLTRASAEGASDAEIRNMLKSIVPDFKRHSPPEGEEIQQAPVPHVLIGS